MSFEDTALNIAETLARHLAPLSLAEIEKLLVDQMPAIAKRAQAHGLDLVAAGCLASMIAAEAYRQAVELKILNEEEAAGSA